MKKFLKAFACLSLALVCVFGFSACGKKLSKTTTDTSKTVYGGGQTSGGITAVYDGYLYFINGTKTNDGTSLKKNTRGAICRVKMNASGEIDKDTYEVVVGDLAGYDYGSLHFFGDFMYYTTPNSAVNYEDNVLFNQTKFMRYDLVNKKSYTLYTTKKNDSSEKLSYGYYAIGDELNLVIYESASETLTSLKIDKKVKTNYVIEGVKSCVLSENYGKSQTSGSSVDANSFVYYTKTFTDTDPVKTDKAYIVSPNSDNSKCIYNGSDNISLLSVRGGKLYYSFTSAASSTNAVVYAKRIQSADTKLSRADSEVVSHKSYTNIIFLDSDKYTAVCHDSEGNSVIVLAKSENNQIEIKPEIIKSVTPGSSSSSSSDDSGLSFIGVTTLSEKVEAEEEGGEEKTDKVTYLIYRNEKKLYKLEILRNDEISRSNDPVLLSTTEFNGISSYLIPEVVGNYVYAYANEIGSDGKSTGKVYMYRADLLVSNNSKDKATFVGIVEE